MDINLKLSGEGQSSGSMTYSMERYLKSDTGVTERLLKGLDVGGIVGRAQAVRGEVDKLADGVTQPAQGPS
ncbi:hypothetical protein C7999DRAFT_13139 [Corynascus novoguineensis]|uniref:Uncharacterized protein n=1 Tax=Corynascus novoguineensis TaxID=1126955 RepID=A0AAN7CV29_9PEZI|nr:hypothetical protein C7999DRAFT_13139 [Corynascus novoguineensis]